jgi:hypothetical protein
MNYIADHYLRNGWHDAGMAPLLPFPGSGSTLVTGTGSSYPARLVAYQALVDGHNVIRTTHGGDPPLYSDVLWPIMSSHSLPTMLLMVQLGPNRWMQR